MANSKTAQNLQTSLSESSKHFRAATAQKRDAWSCRLLLLTTVFTYASTLGLAQTVASKSDTQNVLREMFRLAGVIFTGQVVAIHRHEGNDGATGVVEIQFLVEDAIRGVNAGSYTLRELAGPGSPGAAPYCVGQSYLMMLHKASKEGLNSPVGGMSGAIPIRGSKNASAQIPSRVGAARVSEKQADGRIVDLRWVATWVEQPISYRVSAFPSKSPVIARPLVAQRSFPQEPAPAPSHAADAETMPEDLAESESVPYLSLLTTLRNWAKDENAVR